MAAVAFATLNAPMVREEVLQQRRAQSRSYILPNPAIMNPAFKITGRRIRQFSQVIPAA